MKVTLDRIPNTTLDFVYVDQRLVGQIQEGQISVARDWASIGDTANAIKKDAPIILFRKVTERVKHAIAKKVIDAHHKGDVVFYDPPPPIPERYLIKQQMR